MSSFPPRVNVTLPSVSQTIRAPGRVRWVGGGENRQPQTYLNGCTPDSRGHASAEGRAGRHGQDPFGVTGGTLKLVDSKLLQLV